MGDERTEFEEGHVQRTEPVVACQMCFLCQKPVNKFLFACSRPCFRAQLYMVYSRSILAHDPLFHSAFANFELTVCPQLLNMKMSSGLCRELDRDRLGTPTTGE
jgi:hypothetical protein